MNQGQSMKKDFYALNKNSIDPSIVKCYQIKRVGEVFLFVKTFFT